MPESNLIFDHLLDLNECCLITYESQPSDCPWQEAPDVTGQQFAYLELSGEIAVVRKLREKIAIHNGQTREGGGRITIVEPATTVPAASRLFTSPNRDALERAFPDRDIDRADDGTFYCVSGHPYRNERRYLNTMLEMLSADARPLFEGHECLVLLTDNYNDSTRLFDDVCMMMAREQDDTDGFAEEIGISNLSDLQ